ncbi:MAG: hypothetical protein LBC09_00010 [Helicobacteraceae bacterium]|nr:hypothetical protein [Helicobacteraceae bacterium]
MVALKQILVSFIPPLLIALICAAIAYTNALGVLAIAPDFAIFCAALALAIAAIFGAVLGRSAIAHAALFALAIFWLVIGGRMENTTLECVKALSWHLLPVVAAIFAALNECPFWSAQGILRLLCVSIALFLIALISLSPYAINFAAALEYGFGDMILGVPKGAAFIYALTWILFLIRAYSQRRKLVPTALGVSCGAFLAGIALGGDRALSALFFGGGALILIIGALPFSFAVIATKPQKRREAKAPPQPKAAPLKAASAEPVAFDRNLPQTAPIKTRLLAKLSSFRPFALAKDRLTDRAKSLLSPAKTRLVLAHPDLRFFDTNDKVGVILSPAYYWYKRSEALFKSRRLAKRFAASVFFGWIPEGSYHYYAFKEEGGWGFIACDPVEATRRLIDQGLDARLISRIYFAQSALDPAQSPIALSQNTALSFVNGAWVALPLKFAADAQPFDQTPRVLSAPSFAPPRSRETSDMPRKRFALAASFLLIVIAALAVDIFRISSLANAYESEREEILTRAKLPATQLQLESIERRLTQIASAQQGLRLTLNKLLTFAPTARLERLDIEGRTITVRFAPTETIDAKTIIERLKAAAPEAEAKEQNNQVWAVAKW